MRSKFLRVLALAGAAALAAPPSTAHEPDPVALTVPTAADLGAVASLTSPILSPDGKLVVAMGVEKGKPVVRLMAASAHPGAPHNFSIPEKYKVNWVRWAGSKKLLVSMATPTRLLGEEARMTRVALLDFGTGKTSFVGPREQGLIGDDLIHVDREGKFVLLSTQPSIYEYPSVFRVDLDTGKSERIVRAQEHVWSWYADNSGVVRAGIGVDGKKWWLLYRTAADQEFKRIKRTRDDGTDVDKFIPLDGSDQGFAVAAGATGRFGLYRYDFLADRVGEQLYENPSVDIDDFDLLPDGKVAGVYYTDDKPEVAWIDPQLKALQGRIDRALPGKVNRVVSTSRDKMRLLVWSSAADDPGIFYFYDRATREMSPFAAPHEALFDKRLAAMEPVRYKARDGLEIRAYLTLPPGRSDKNLPLIVMPHGGPFARDAWGFDPWVQYLASKGYAVLQPNFRGSTGFGKSFVEKGYGAWGRAMQDDIDDGVKWLAGRGTADAKRVCIMGASFGGYAAMWAAVRNPDLYRCAISLAGISDVGSMLRYDRKSFSAPRYARDWQSKVQGDKGFELDQISPIKSVDKLGVPILIAHGDEDDNVPLYQSRRLHEALEKLGRPHEYVVYKGEGHGFADPDNATDFLSRVGKFLDTHNPS
ncbi:MAG: S9 family peptidase [Sphingomonas sp.]|uniref:alpha/beta hydrolase family protein n=1 Tax=Sphingomonas sp. TaxID=28214 RepID=UPI001B123CB7|nr:S9 family peptidase [Sphingomonas sp.]MBO9621505.1 S9 family peptidase [Sphingomonas sp.]